MGFFEAFAVGTTYQRYRKKLKTLAHEMDNLKAIEREWGNRIRKEEMLRGQLCSRRVKTWFQKVQLLEESVQNLPLVTHKSISYYRHVANSIRHAVYICKIKMALTEAKLLHDEYESMNKADIGSLLQSSQVDQKCDVWIDKKGRLSRLLTLVNEETVGGVRIIGIRGMGGLGKTALMRHLYDAITKEERETATSSDEPDTVIKWFHVSMDYNVIHIQDQMAKALQLNLSKSSDVKARASYISHALSKKRKYVLFFDDVWDVFDLEEIGIPVHSDEELHKSNVLIFTTRSSQICSLVSAQMFDVPFLDETESVSLFMKLLGIEDVTLEQGVLEQLWSQCDGLPLALVVLARQVLGKILKNGLPPRLPFGDNRLSRLMMSYANEIYTLRNEIGAYKYGFGCLTDEEISCLLYCSFAGVTLDEVVNQLAGEESFPYLSTNLYAAKEKINSVIEKLANMSLLQRYQGYYGEQHLTMHIFIKKVLSMEHQSDHIVINSVTASLFQNWGIQRVKVSLAPIEELPDVSPLCLNMRSLLINNGCITHIPSSFFTYMPALQVLDLSHNMITLLPKTIKDLSELRYLNLSFTKIKALPLELGYLRKMKQLYLRGTISLLDIHKDCFSGLLQLQALGFMGSDFFKSNKNDDPSQLSFMDIETIPQLEEFDISIDTATSLDRLLSLDKLCLVTRALTLRGIDDEKLILRVLKIMPHIKDLTCASGTFETSFTQLVRLEKLRLYDCNFSDIVCTRESCITPFCSLQHLTIFECNEVYNISWVQFASLLKYLYVTFCNGIKELFIHTDNDPESEPFSNLEVLKIKEMSNLEIIYRGSLSLPSLKELDISGCHHLKGHWFQESTGTIAMNKNVQILSGGIRWRASINDLLQSGNICPSISLAPIPRSTHHQDTMAVAEDTNKENEGLDTEDISSLTMEEEEVKILKKILELISNPLKQQDDMKLSDLFEPDAVLINSSSIA